MSKHKKSDSDSEIDKCQEIFVNDIPVNHWDYPIIKVEDIQGPARWALERLKELSNVFCQYYCDRDNCNCAEIFDNVQY